MVSYCRIAVFRTKNSLYRVRLTAAQVAELRGTNYRNFVVSNSVEGVEPKSSEEIEAEFELRGTELETSSNFSTL